MTRAGSIVARCHDDAAWPLAAVLGFALVLRVGAAFALPSIHHPDEIFQTLEPAHRLLHGTGIVSWEFVWGIRSWLYPGLLAAIMWAGEQVSASPDAAVNAVAVGLAVFSLVPVACGFLWGREAAGPLGGCTVGLVAAAWPDLVYFATKSLTEVAAANFMVAGLFVARRSVDPASRVRLSICGLLLGLALAIRFHLTPALVVAAMAVARADVRRRWLPLIAGGSLPVLFAGMLDWATWGMPFQSIWLNYALNIGAGISDEFTVSPWFQYVRFFVNYWPGMLAIVLPTAIAGARQEPRLAAVALAVIAAHAFIGHKEFRFIYPAIPLVAVVCGLGTVEITRRLAHAAGPRRGAASAVWGTALAAWFVGFAVSAAAPDYRALWSSGSGAVRAARAVAAEPSLCGIAMHGVPWWRTGGHVLMHRPVPLYDFASAAELAANQRGFNLIVYGAGTMTPDDRFSLRGCWRRDPTLPSVADGGGLTICVAARPGGCEPIAARPPALNVPAPLRAAR